MYHCWLTRLMLVDGASRKVSSSQAVASFDRCKTSATSALMAARLGTACSLACLICSIVCLLPVWLDACGSSPTKYSQRCELPFSRYPPSGMPPTWNTEMVPHPTMTCRSSLCCFHGIDSLHTSHVFCWCFHVPCNGWQSTFSGIRYSYRTLAEASLKMPYSGVSWQILPQGQTPQHKAIYSYFVLCSVQRLLRSSAMCVNHDNSERWVSGGIFSVLSPESM